MKRKSISQIIHEHRACLRKLDDEMVRTRAEYEASRAQTERLRKIAHAAELRWTQHAAKPQEDVFAEWGIGRS